MINKEIITEVITNKHSNQCKTHNLLLQIIKNNIIHKSISMPKGHGFALTPYKGALGIINAIP